MITCIECSRKYEYSRSAGHTKKKCNTCRTRKTNMPAKDKGNCRTCKLTKSKNEFYRDQRRSNGLSSECKECRKARGKKNTANGYYTSKHYKDYFAKNREKINAQRRAKPFKMPEGDKKLLQYMRTRLYQALKNNQKSGSTLELLGVQSTEELWQHLEAQFTEGMTRENYGEWHVDHIKPCASFDFSDPEQQKECFHYSNLQPLWAEDNLAKGASE